MKINIKENLFGRITIKIEGDLEEFHSFLKQKKKSSKSQKTETSSRVASKINKRNELLIDIIKKINPENNLISKKEFIETYRREFKVSRPTVYNRFRLVEKKFHSEKNGRRVLIKLGN